VGILFLRPSFNFSLFGGDDEPTVEVVPDATHTPLLPSDEPLSDATANPEMTLAEAEKLVQQYPRDGRAHIFYGYALIKNGDEEEGYTEIKKGVTLAAKNQAVLLASAKAFEEREEWLGAAIVYIKMNENVKTMLPARVEAMHRAVYYAFAKEIAPEVLNYDTIGAVDQALGLIANIRYNLNEGDNEDLANALIDQLMVLHPNLAEIKLLRAELLIDQAKNDQAKTLLQELISSSNVSLWIKDEAQKYLSELQ
jgi:tetratricopeptide (TPR) repeat protein